MEVIYGHMMEVIQFNSIQFNNFIPTFTYMYMYYNIYENKNTLNVETENERSTKLITFPHDTCNDNLNPSVHSYKKPDPIMSLSKWC